MIRVLFPLGLLFVFIGVVLFRSAGYSSADDLPTLYHETGVLSKIDNYKTSKFGEVLYFELQDLEERFWLKARLEKTPAVKEQLLKVLKLGDTVTAEYTSLKGTNYEYASAPNSVRSIEINGQTIKGLSFVAGNTSNQFMNMVLYTVGSMIFLVGVVILGIAIRLVWIAQSSKG